MPLPDPPSSSPRESSSDPFTLVPARETAEARESLPPLPVAKKPGRPGWGVLQWIANALLWGAVVEGVFDLASCFPVVTRGGTQFEFVAGVWSLGVTLLFVMELLAMSSFRELPWRELSPLLGLLLWSRFLFLPLPGLFEWDNVVFMGSALFLVVGCATAGMIRKHWGCFWIPAQAFEAVRFSWGRTAVAAVLKLFVVLPVLLVYVAWSCVWMIHWKTNGFLQVDGSGIKVEARVYERGAAKVYLLPTAHIGSGRFYEELMRGVPVDRSVLLPEGVSDRTGLLAARWSYAGVAKAAGLREQPDFARNLSGAAVEACDVDMSDFSEETQKALSLIAMSFQFLSEGDRQRATEVLEGWEFGGRLDRKLFRKISHDLIDKRNAKVTASVERVSRKYDHVLVPWGALHMAGIEGGLLKQGFRRIEDREVRMLRWEDFVRGVLKL